MKRSVLLLNCGGGEILDIIPWQDAMQMLYREKECVKVDTHFDDLVIRSAHKEHKCPSVLSLLKYEFIPFDRRVAVNKLNVLQRDNHMCQYCGKSLTMTSATIDHIYPESRGGKREWKNITAACRKCNVTKDNKTPKEAGMKLLNRPYVFTKEMLYLEFANKPEYSGWKKYFNSIL